MSPNDSPPVKKRRSNDTEQGWWACLVCLRNAVCPEHAGAMLSCAGDAGRAELQNRLKGVQAQLKKAEKKAANLQRALQRLDGAVTSPTLLISHAGWTEGGKGWRAGRLPLTLALPATALDPPLADAVCKALRDAALELEGCSSGLLYARGLALPDALLELLPARPRHELRPGAVVVDPARRRMFVYIRRAPQLKKGDSSTAKLLGYLLQEGLDSLAFDHVPNARTFTDCVYCCRNHNVSIRFTSVVVQPHSAGANSDVKTKPASKSA